MVPVPQKRVAKKIERVSRRQPWRNPLQRQRLEDLMREVIRSELRQFRDQLQPGSGSGAQPNIPAPAPVLIDQDPEVPIKPDPEVVGSEALDLHGAPVPVPEENGRGDEVGAVPVAEVNDVPNPVPPEADVAAAQVPCQCQCPPAGVSAPRKSWFGLGLFGKGPSRGANSGIDPPVLEVLLGIKPSIPDSVLCSGNFKAWKLDPSNEEYRRVDGYFRNSLDQNKTPPKTLKSILKIDRPRDEVPNGLEAFPRMMLWHGVTDRQVGEILHNGFKLEGSSSSKKSFFFADRAGKAMRNVGGKGSHLLLCEVFLGRGTGTNDSIKFPGALVPNESENVAVGGCIWPMGSTLTLSSVWHCGFQNTCNEYVVYKPEQIRVRYLVQFG